MLGAATVPFRQSGCIRIWNRVLDVLEAAHVVTSRALSPLPRTGQHDSPQKVGIGRLLRYRRHCGAKAPSWRSRGGPKKARSGETEAICDMQASEIVRSCWRDAKACPIQAGLLVFGGSSWGFNFTIDRIPGIGCGPERSGFLAIGSCNSI